MTGSHRVRSTAKWFGAGAGVALGVYGAYVALTWFRYGNPPEPARGEEDALLDRFMPAYDVVERHHSQVNAPASLTLAAAKEMDLSQIRAVRAIFKGRELLLGATPNEQGAPRGVFEDMRALGWVVLDEVPGREVVMGAVTKPWEPNVTFRSIAPDEFAAFAEPDYVKIVWNLRADPQGETRSTFRMETRALATDLDARRKFRRYWAFLSPGITLIRWLSLGPVKAAAERKVRQ